MKPGIFLHMAQTIDTVAHDQPHGAGIVIWPDAFGAMSLFDPNEVFSNKIERRVPGDALELAGSLRVSASQRMEHALRMVFTLRVARNFRADYTHRVIVIRRAMHASDCALVEQLHIERAS